LIKYLKNYYRFNFIIPLKKLIHVVQKSYTSVFQVNLSNLNNQITKWHNEVPNIKPYYAVKSLPHESILKHLAISNVNFDCASKGEIESVLKYSGPQNIIYANPSKSNEDISYANSKNVDHMVVDSLEEIKKMDLINPNLKKIIRIKSVETNSDIKFNSKFGASPEEVFQMIDYLHLNNNKSFEGFSFHVGSKCKSEESYFLTIKNITDNYYNYCVKKNMPIKVIDIGGGFSYHNNLDILYKTLQPFYNNFYTNNVKLIAEPGRYFAEPSIDLYCKVISIKKRDFLGKPIYHITINDSVYSTFNGKLYDGQEYTPIPLYSQNQYNVTTEWVDCVIFGQTCDSLDVICEKIKLPLPKLNDVFKFQNMGAYSLASCYGKFNGFQEPKEMELE
jgi:ornithine decarboxylase